MYRRQCPACGKYTYSSRTTDTLHCAYCGKDITDQPLLPETKDDLENEQK